MGPKLFFVQAILQSSFGGFGGVRGGDSQLLDAGVKGSSGGRRPPSTGGRRSASQMKVPKSKGMKRASKSGQSTADATAKNVPANTYS